MVKIKKSQAFSLIELSIVILVVGVLIAGVVQSRNMINKFKLQTARSLTNSSSVLSIKDLALWLETTSDKSFIDPYPNDQDRIAIWRDLNAQVSLKNNATQSNESLKPYFYENAINSLPGVYFAPSTNQILNGTYPINSINSATGSFSFFLVAVSNQSGNFQTPFDTGIWNNQGWAFNKLQSAYSNNIRFNLSGPSYATGTLAPNGVVQIYSTVLDDNSKLWYYINGGTQIYTNASANAPAVTTVSYRVGNDQSWINALGSAPWRGYIGEIIVYSRALKTDERKSIEKYLGQKWDIMVQQS